MLTNTKKMQNVLSLPGPKRYSHFVKVAADQRKVWGLYAGGWALGATSAGVQAFPLWPAREYAELCAKADWSGYEPKAIELDTLIEVLIPKLKESSTILGIFPTPSEKGITPEFDQLVADLRSELGRIE